MHGTINHTMSEFVIKDFLSKREPHNGRFFTIAIDGRGGSGKTHLAAYLKNILKDFTFIEGDDYF
jgi:uridine kinase